MLRRYNLYVSRQTIKLYFSLTKPGVLFGNAITVAAGFLLAAAGRIDWWLLLIVFGASSLIIASACVTNNALDADIDQKMSRTKNRAVAAGLIKPWQAFVFAGILGITGLALLGIYSNELVIASGVIGWIVYVWAYGVWSKRKSIYGTWVGAISGAVPILAGYLAVTNRIDIAAGLLFISLLVWQIPEFYSIGIYRRQEYQAANLPILPVVEGIGPAKSHIFVAVIVFVVSSCLLTPLGYTGYTYEIIMLSLGLYWLWLGWQGFDAVDSEAWARKMFKYSINLLLVYCVMLALGPLIP